MPAPPISFISGANSNVPTVTIGTHAIRDMILMMSWAASATPPTAAGGFTSIGTVVNGSALAGRLGYKIAATTSETSGTWTGANILEAVVYRGTSGTAPGTPTTNTGSGTTITYPALTVLCKPTSWVVRFGASTASTNLNSAPVTGYTFRTGAPSNNCGAYDSAAGVLASPATTAQTVSPTGTWDAVSVEIFAIPPGVAVNAAPRFRSSLY